STHRNERTGAALSPEESTGLRRVSLTGWTTLLHTLARRAVPGWARSSTGPYYVIGTRPRLWPSPRTGPARSSPIALAPPAWVQTSKLPGEALAQLPPHTLIDSS